MSSRNHRPLRVTRRTVMGAGLAATFSGLLVYRSPRASASATVGSGDIYDELLQRWIGVIIGPNIDNPDYADAVAAQDEIALKHLGTMITAPGSNSPWEDLPLGQDETDASTMTKVATRLRAIAVGYATPASQLYADDDAGRSVAAGVKILHDSVYHEDQQQYANWWDWEIGTPKALTDTCVLIGEALDTEVLTGVLAAVDHFIPDPTRMIDDTLDSTGANRVDLCRSVALRGALGRAADKLSLASDSLAGVLDIVHVGDGFHSDGSFIMHRVIAYPGTYGELLVRGMAELMTLLAGTDWEVAENERQRVTEAIDRSYAPFMYGGLMMDSVRGRAVSRTGTRDVDNGFRFACGLIGLARALPESDTTRQFMSMAKGWLRRNDFRPLTERTAPQIAAVVTVLEDDSIPSIDDRLGHFGFPDAERVTHRRDGWGYSLSMNSDRVARFEYMNGENLKGWHTGDGMLLLYLDDDLYQYTDEFWPTVDAKRLPGTTVDTAALEPGSGGDIDNEPLTGTRLSGMVTLRGGDSSLERGVGLATMDLHGHESPLTARKSWLFLDDAVLAAGSGISTAPGAGRRIETILDNRNLHSPDDPLDASVSVNGEPVPVDLGETITLEDVRSIHIEDVGGYVPLPLPGSETVDPIRVLREDRTGAWSEINERGPGDSVTRRYLTLWYDHGTDPDDHGYAHLHMPLATADDVEQRAADPAAEVVKLTAGAHAFRASIPGEGARPAVLTAVSFFAAGSAAGITVDAPCAVLMVRDDSAATPLRMAISDPSRTAATVTVDVDDVAYRAVQDTDERVTVLRHRGGVRLVAETGGSHGASLAVSLGSDGDRPQRHVHLLEPHADATVRGGAHAGENFGSDERLTIHSAESEDDTRRAYLSFDLGDVSSSENLRRAVLWLYGAIPVDPDDRDTEMLQVKVHAHGPVAEEWRESEITWHNAPRPGQRRDSAWATVYPDWIGLDVTDAVRTDSDRVSLVVAQSGEGHRLDVGSREGSHNHPLLEIVTGR